MKRLLASAAIVGASCGGAGGSTPAPTGTVTETANYAGVTRSTSATTCTGDVHTFSVAPGAISVLLLSTSTGEALTAQICPPASLDCTLARTRINVGQTIEATARGGTTQVLSLLPLNCGTDAPPSSDAIAYIARVTYRR